MTNNEEICQGCLTYNVHNPVCRLTPIKGVKDDEICPCLNCLIKSMCTDPCDHFAIYMRSIYGSYV